MDRHHKGMFEISWETVATFATLLASLAFIVALFAAIEAISATRTSQGAIAWVFALLSFPLITLPLYWIFGRSKFQGYILAHRSSNQDLQSIPDKLKAELVPTESRGGPHAVEALTGLPWTTGNQVDLLINGEEIFSSMYEAIASAQKYILVQFYIIRDDEHGQELQQHLLNKLKTGVDVYLLVDAIGAHSLPDRYLEELRAAGAHARYFRTTKGKGNRFQINFRNHRKTVIADGQVGFIGGSNVGNEYMSRNEHFGLWRDTMVRIEGPAVPFIQLAFLEDWYWVEHHIPALHWKTDWPAHDDMRVSIIPSGPADAMETFGLVSSQAIHTAKQRVWISSPYFVPDEGIIRSLQLAALRGVDVRILIPEKVDHLMVWLASFWFVQQLQLPQIKVFRYTEGFLHQKAYLVDDQYALIGTANFDNRSMRLNFELSALIDNPSFATQVEDMFKEDFSHSREVSLYEYQHKPLHFRTGVQIARLLAPLL